MHKLPCLDKSMQMSRATKMGHKDGQLIFFASTNQSFLFPVVAHLVFHGLLVTRVGTFFNTRFRTVEMAIPLPFHHHPRCCSLGKMTAFLPMEVSCSGGTPSHHPFFHGIFHWKPAIGVAPGMLSPIPFGPVRGLPNAMFYDPMGQPICDVYIYICTYVYIYVYIYIFIHMHSIHYQCFLFVSHDTVDDHSQ